MGGTERPIQRQDGATTPRSTPSAAVGPNTTQLWLFEASKIQNEEEKQTALRCHFAGLASLA